ncbi:hypothetical protein [uncultured Methanolobus sp.]|uniref:hypothetical protein n=1 Tax=uncultured Methanolobus sp. TaxID=218300 RepID=UPI002AAAC36D|nr:hypothetical protein [uncultured Methanolobus sp.]
MHKCSDLMLGQSMICEGCGLELKVIHECDHTCNVDKCCDLSDLICPHCQEKMKFKA